MVMQWLVKSYYGKLSLFTVMVLVLWKQLQQNGRHALAIDFLTDTLLACFI